MKYSIYVRKEGIKDIFWVKAIYQKWCEEDTPYKRRAKREFKKFQEQHKQEGRTFILIDEEE